LLRESKGDTVTCSVEIAILHIKKD
jgi:hypothetical protein